MNRKLKFEIYGDTDEINWDPSLWIDLNSYDEFLVALLEVAEEQATWGAHLVGDDPKKLWKEVQEVKNDE